MSEYIKDIVTVSKEAGKAVIKMNDRLFHQIWHLVKDWPDIISNEENLKILAELNFARKEEIEELTSALYEIFKTFSCNNEIVVHITEVADK